MRKIRSIVGVAVMTLLGCGGSESAGQPAAAPAVQTAADPAAQVNSPAATPKLAEPPKAAIEDTTFRLALESEGAYTAGQPAKVKLVLEARSGYHVNQEYPIRVDLKAPGVVKLDKASLTKPDATAFGEDAARFDVHFSADKGAHDLLATVDFAVCTKDTCVPDQRTVAAVLKVD